MTKQFIDARTLAVMTVTLVVFLAVLELSAGRSDAKVCDASTCPNGCCAGPWCRPGTADGQCGTGGAACENCTSAAETCNWEQECVSCTGFLQQEADTSYVGILSMEFADPYGPYDAYSAEDFTVPEDAWWVIDRFDFGGCGTNGGDPGHATGYHVLIYAHDGSHPAGYPGGDVDPIWAEYWSSSDPRVSFNRDYHEGITLFTGDVAAVLPAGHYWVMIYLDWTTWETDVFWYWAMATVGSGDRAMYINPDGGWGVGTEWLPVQNVGGFNETDLALTLSNCGTVVDDDTIFDDDSSDDDASSDDDTVDDDSAVDDDTSPDSNANGDDDSDNGCGC